MPNDQENGAGELASGGSVMVNDLRDHELQMQRERNRITIAIIVIGGLIVLLLTSLIGQVGDPEVLGTIFGTWIVTILAFYFVQQTSDNAQTKVQEASRETRQASREAGAATARAAVEKARADWNKLAFDRSWMAYDRFKKNAQGPMKSMMGMSGQFAQEVAGQQPGPVSSLQDAFEEYEEEMADIERMFDDKG